MKRQPKKNIVLVGGCFDLLHYGHISFLKKAKQHGDWLVVALESDQNVNKLKGSLRPIHDQKKRADMLGALSCVDEVILLPIMKTDNEYKVLVERINPSVIAVTQGDHMTKKKKAYAHAVNARFVEIPYVPTPSTSQLAKLLGLE